MEADAGAKAVAPLWRRSILGIGTVAIMALVLALAAVLELIDADAAVQGCLGLAVIAAVSLAFARTRLRERFSESAFIAAQMGAVFLLLAWLTIRAEDTPAAIAVLYLVAMLYGVLQLDRTRLAALAAIALVTHGVAIFVLIDQGVRISLAAAWTQFGALVLAMGWFAYAAGIVLRLRARLGEAHARMHDLAREAEYLARRDGLTAAFHHQHVMESLEREIARSDRHGKPLSIARVDLGGLREINDAEGTAAGDQALKRFAAAVNRALRNVDVLGRYGGSEFLAVLPDTDIRGALVAAERIRASVAGEGLACSIGVAEHAKGGGTRALLARAESGLNLAKAAGRDRVVALGPAGEPVALGAAA